MQPLKHMHHAKTKQKRTPMSILKPEQKKLAHIKTIDFFKNEENKKRKRKKKKTWRSLCKVKQKDIVDVCVVAIAKQRNLQNFTHTIIR